MSKLLFRKISVISYNNKRFQVFMDDNNRYAFLELDDNNKYHYPTIEDFVGLANIFSKNLDNKAFFRDTKNKNNKYFLKRFVRTSAAVMALSSVLYLGLKEQNLFNNDNVDNIISIDYDVTPEELVESNQEIIDDVSVEEVNIYVSETDPIITVHKSHEVTEDMYGIYGDEIDIYDSTALNKFLGDKTITINDIQDVINQNDNLDSSLKLIFNDFSEKIMTTYPDIDMRLFYENVKNLKVIYETQEDVNEHGTTPAWFNYENNEIHINQYMKSEMTPHDLMILRHEIGHMISLAIIKTDDNKTIICKICNGGYGYYLQEAIDVIITSTPYTDEYDFTNFGYSINTNELESVISVIPDFDYSVLANQDVYNIAKYLDSVNPNGIYASRFIDLMDMQALAFYNSESISVQNTEFIELYRYIANTYVNNVFNSDMTYDEIMNIRNNLIDNLEKNLGDSSKVSYYEEIDNVFNQYMEKNNIVNTSLIKH